MSAVRRAMLCLCATPALLFLPACAREPLDITFLDVGYGDAMALRCGSRAMVIDGGYGRGQSDQGRRVLLPWLASNGVTRLDAVVCTHSHEDHVGGLCDVLEALRVDAVCRPVWRSTNAYTVQFDALVRAKEIPCTVVSAGHAWAWGPVNVRVLTPPPGGADVMAPPIDLNATSAALDLTYGDARALLLADITTPVLRELLATSSDWHAAVVKIPHHGATDAYCPAFLDAVQPVHAVLSVGPNPYGNPSDAVMAAYQSRTRVWRTDRDHHITLRCHADGSVTPVLQQP